MELPEDIENQKGQIVKGEFRLTQAQQNEDVCFAVSPGCEPVP